MLRSIKKLMFILNLMINHGISPATVLSNHSVIDGEKPPEK